MELIVGGVVLILFYDLSEGFVNLMLFVKNVGFEDLLGFVNFVVDLVDNLDDLFGGVLFNVNLVVKRRNVRK